MTELSAPTGEQRIRQRIRFRGIPSTQPKTTDSAPAGGSARPAHDGFRPDIEGLRAVTLFAIFGFHAAVPGMHGGFVGPDVFFEISGFLITGQLWREVSTTGRLRLGRFYGGRARRLLPVAATVGIATVIASAFLLPPLQADAVFRDGVSCAMYVGNISFALQLTDYFSSGTPSPFLHYWTLGVEEQFYLLWPVLIVGAAWLVRLIRRRAKGTEAQAPLSKRPFLVLFALMTVASFALSVVVTYALEPMAYFLLPTRAWDFTIGALVALTAAQWRRLPPRVAVVTGWVGLGAILVTLNQLTPATPYPGTAALLPVLGTALIIGAGCATPTQGCGRILAVAPMRYVGRLSYAWYLWHWPMLVLIPVWLGHPLSLIGRLAILAVSGGLAILTLRFIENPLRFAAPLRRSPRASLAVGAAATALAVSVSVALLGITPPPIGRGAPAPTLAVTAATPPPGSGVDAYDAAVQHAFAQVQAAVAASADVRAVPSNLEPALADTEAETATMRLNGCFRALYEVDQPADCAAGDTASATTVTLIGDSNAAMWSRAFQQVATQRHWRLETLAKAACPVLDLPIIDSVLHREYTECEQWRAQILARLAAERPQLIVLSIARLRTPDTGFPSYSPASIDSLGRLVQQLRGTGARVLVLGPIPDPHSQAEICLSGHLDDATACAQPRSAAVNEAGIAAEAAATKAGGGQYADITDLFCTDARCPVIVGNTQVYVGRSHLTLEYTRQLEPVMGLLIGRALASG